MSLRWKTCLWAELQPRFLGLQWMTCLGQNTLIVMVIRSYFIIILFKLLPSVGNANCSFSNLSITSPTLQLILHPFRRFTYVTAHSPTLPLLYLRHSSFPNPYFASPTSQALHLRHLASRPCL